MKVKELKELLKDAPDNNDIGFYIVGKNWDDAEDERLPEPEVICSNGLKEDGCIDFGFPIKEKA